MYQDDSFATGYAVGRDSNNCYGNNSGWGFGNGWEGLIGLVLVAALFGGGWGGFGFGGNRSGNCATQADLSAGFANSEIMSDLNDIILGQAQMQNFINQGFSGLQNSLCQGFAGVNNAICTLGYQNQAGFNAVSNQIASCCCDLKQINLENRYLNEKQTCDIISAINAGNQRLVDIYTSDKISALQTENASLKGQISNDRQTQNIISGLRDSNCPLPAYFMPNPNCCYNPFTFYGYGNGCGTCGASVQ